LALLIKATIILFLVARPAPKGQIAVTEIAPQRVELVVGASGLILYFGAECDLLNLQGCVSD